MTLLLLIPIAIIAFVLIVVHVGRRADDLHARTATAARGPYERKTRAEWERAQELDEGR